MIKKETAKAGERVEGLSEYSDRRICSYLLEEPVHFSHAGYNRMRKSSLSFLIPGHKIFYDGKIKLIYRTEGKVRLCEAAENLTQKQWNCVMEQLFAAAHQLKEESYFPFGQLELEPEKIYLDLKTYQIYIIYLPVYHENQAISIQILEKEIRKKLEILNKMFRKDTQKNVLQRLGSTQNEIWELTGDSFVIGKQKEQVQCWIPDHSALSRRHCKLLWNHGQWWLMDLDSRNGTFLNKTRLIPWQWYALKVGDRIFAADCEFCLLYGCFSVMPS